MRQTKPRHATTAAQSSPQPDDGDPVPKDIDAFRYALARRIHRFIGDHERAWRHCPEGCCRRARHCIAPSGKCVNLPPRRPMTAEQDARFRAQLHRMVRERLERDEAQNREAAT